MFDYPTEIIERHTLGEVRNGQFDFRHDSVLKVRYFPGCPMRDDYFTCKSLYVGSLVALISSLSAVRYVKIIPIHEFDD